MNYRDADDELFAIVEEHGSEVLGEAVTSRFPRTLRAMAMFVAKGNSLKTAMFDAIDGNNPYAGYTQLHRPKASPRWMAEFRRESCDQTEHAVLISATVRNSPTQHEVSVRTGGSTQSLAVPSMPSGEGSAVNGGEFLMVALATCYCNDLYREAKRLNLKVEEVVVEATADFPGVGLAATNIQYKVKVSSPATPQDITDLVRQTDAVAEVHNTLRGGAAVTLSLDHSEQ